MIIQASIFRMQDGLPLSATTDVDQRPVIRECQKYIKLIAKKVNSLPDRGTLKLQGFHIHFTSALNVSYLVLVEEMYSTLLSFCFLEEVQKEFLVTFDHTRVSAARRPYPFIEFDNYLQKTKHRYNSPRSLATKINLSDMSTEMKLRPPYQVCDDDLDLLQKSDYVFTPRKDTQRPMVNPGRKLIPVNWVAMIAILLNLFSTALNMTRGMGIISHGHFDAEDFGAYRYGSAFLVAAGLSAYQIYLIFYHSKWRHLQNGSLFVSLSACHIYLRDFRNLFQLVFHLIVTLFSSIVILYRKRTEKLPGYMV